MSKINPEKFSFISHFSLIDAITHKHMLLEEEWQKLINSNYNFNITNCDNNSALMLALKNEIKLPKRIFDQIFDKSDLNQKNRDFDTPLMLALNSDFGNTANLTEEQWDNLFETFKNQTKKSLIAYFLAEAIFNEKIDVFTQEQKAEIFSYFNPTPTTNKSLSHNVKIFLEHHNLQKAINKNQTKQNKTKFKL
jgi:hypothetical protein